MGAAEVERRSVGIRRASKILLYVLLFANLVALLITVLWPSTGRDWAVPPAHLRWADQTGYVGMCVFPLAMAALWVPRRLVAWWAMMLSFEALQVLRAILAARVRTWPGSEDFLGLAWDMVIWYLRLLAFIGAVVVLLEATRRSNPARR